jgi:glucose-6-phosphate 1-epimerase
LAFSGALHTYFSVADVSKATLQGLGGRAEWDSVTDAHAVADPTLRFVGQFDRVYDAPNRPMLLDQQLQIEQSPAWANTVVWNPGPVVCAQLADMPADGWQHMLCVEAAQVFDPITLPPGAVWEAWQQLQVLNP